MATRTLATWALALQYSNLTTEVVDSAVKSIYNWAGCAIGGFAQDAPSIALNTTSPFFGGPATSTIFGSKCSIRRDAQITALVNGIASHIDDYDDTHLETIIHPAGPVTSALLAVAEWKAPVSGQDFLTSFVAGIEAECKLGLSVYPEHYDVGWHITSTTGSIGAAVAVGKLLNLDLETLQQAIGIAATQVVGMQEYFGSDTKSFHVGRAAQGGMMAALLAQNGYTSSLQGLEAKFGWANVVSTRQNLTDEFATLGQTWEIAKNTFKPFPCGIVIHPTIDACIQLHDMAVEQGLDITSIQTVTARVNPQVLVLTGKTDPQTGLEGKFSVYHAAATALLYGESTPTEFTDEAVLNATVVDLRKKVNTTTDSTVRTDEAYVTVLFDDGTTLDIHVEHALGSLQNPLSVDQLKTKFIGQASKVLGTERAEKAYDAFLNIGTMADVGKIGTLF
ncbi:2-methylcitrate dehydratase PrpD [Thozetella sp. PMI_491]|nr:2-methylcitrate dehydratase PrpD [Thozetella sp. PMI_491]